MKLLQFISLQFVVYEVSRWCELIHFVVVKFDVLKHIETFDSFVDVLQSSANYFLKVVCLLHLLRFAIFYKTLNLLLLTLLNELIIIVLVYLSVTQMELDENLKKVMDVTI